MLRGDKRAGAKLMLLLPVSLVIIGLGVAVGSADISFFDTAKVIFSKITGSELPQSISESTAAIIWKLRLPRVLLAFLTGAAMSVGGAVTQSVLGNPLASPYTLGVSSGASLGAAVVTVLGVSLSFAHQMSLALVGTFCAVLTVILCLTVASGIDKNIRSSTIVLLGMVLSLFLSSVFTLISGLSKEKMTLLIRWQMGSFGSKGWETVGVLAPVAAVCIAVILLYSKELDIMSFGDESAEAIGVNIRKTKGLLLLLMAVLTGTAVSFAGVIGFLDLIAPHVARRLFSPKHKYLCPSCALIGGSFMVIADLAARMIIRGTELPVGAVTAFIGAPFFAWVYFSRRKGHG